MEYTDFAQKVKTKYPQYADMSDLELAKRMVAKYPKEYSDVVFDVQNTSTAESEPQKPFLSRLIGEKAYGKLDWFRKKSKEGLDQFKPMMQTPEPTGNLPVDIAEGTIPILKQSIAEAAPEFISPEAIVTGGLSKLASSSAPIVKPLLRWAGKQGEGFSNIKPGALEAAYKDSSLIFSKGKAEAAKLYQQANKDGDIAAQLMDELKTHKEIIDAAEDLAKTGELSPMAGKMARQSLDAMYKTMPKGTFARLRGIFDEAAKSSEKISSADKLHREGLFAESLRHLFPQNKTGGASPFRMFVAQLFNFVPGGETIGKVATAATSPIVQGGIATGAGLLGRKVVPLATNPRAAVGFSALLNKSKQKKK